MVTKWGQMDLTKERVGWGGSARLTTITIL